MFEKLFKNPWTDFWPKPPNIQDHAYWIKFMQKARDRNAKRMVDPDLPEDVRDKSRKSFEKANKELGHRLKMLRAERHG